MQEVPLEEQLSRPKEHLPARETTPTHPLTVTLQVGTTGDHPHPSHHSLTPGGYKKRPEEHLTVRETTPTHPLTIEYGRGALACTGPPVWLELPVCLLDVMYTMYARHPS